MDWIFIFAFLFIALAICYEEDFCEMEEITEWCLSHPIKTTKNTIKYLKGETK